MPYLAPLEHFAHHRDDEQDAWMPRYPDGTLLPATYGLYGGVRHEVRRVSDAVTVVIRHGRPGTAQPPGFTPRQTAAGLPFWQASVATSDVKEPVSLGVHARWLRQHGVGLAGPVQDGLVACRLGLHFEEFQKLAAVHPDGPTSDHRSYLSMVNKFEYEGSLRWSELSQVRAEVRPWVEP